VSALAVEKVWVGRNVTHWRVSRGKAGEQVTVRESALFPRVYCCLTCISNECTHVISVREFDNATENGALAAMEKAS
jgi:hypothetical protein